MEFMNDLQIKVFRAVSALASAIFLTLGLLAGPTSLFAQSDTGRVVGTVSDNTGAMIPGATVTLTNTETSATQTAKADDSGNFTFPAQPRGAYKISVTQSGFASQSQDFVLQVSQVQTVNFKLTLGSETQTVEVTSAAPLVDTSTSTVGEVVEGRQVTELPLNGRNFTQLALLTPGVTRGGYGNAASGIGGQAETFRNASSGGGSLSSNGLRPQANNYILDGIDNNEALVNTLEFFTNIEGTQEFRVNTSTAPAEFGRAGGSIVQSSIKSGTNQIHGSAFWFARSSLFDANPNYQFLGAGPTAPLPFKRNTFGGSVGAPILKDKLFLFGDYQGLRENQPLNSQTLTVPTAAMRNGDFSALLGTGLTQAPSICGLAGVTTVVVNGGVYDPTTCQQFPGNIIPDNRLNSAGLAYLRAYPATNTPGIDNGTQNNYITVRNNISHYNTFDVRLDANLSQADRAFVRFTYDNSNFTRTSEFPALPAGYASGANNVHARGYALGETHVFTASILNEFRAGYNRYTLQNVPVFSNVPVSANLGIVNANRTPQLYGGALIGGNGNQLEYTGDYGTYLVPENTYELNDAVSVTKGPHSFKFGALGIRREVAFFRPISGKGFFNLGNGDFTGYDVSEVVAGFSDYYSIGSQTGFFGTRNYEVGAFAQDDWKASNRLTLNLGFRWDLLTYPTEEHNRQAALNPSNGTLWLAGVNGVSNSIINQRYTNFAPRLGFAYDAYGTGTTVIRGGYGIFYFLDRGGIDNQLGQQVPFGGSVNYNAGNGYRITFTGQNAVNGGLNSTTATGALPLPGYPNFNANNPPVGINVFAVNMNEKTPTVQQYDLQLQQQFGTRTVFTMGYVGNIATHQATGYNYNTHPFSTNPNAPIAFPSLGQVVYNVNDGVSHYNSLQTQLNYHASKGLIFTSSYTWSHNIDNTDGFLGFYAVSPLYFYDHSVNKGNSGLDQRNVFTASAVYDLPFGHGRQFGANINRGLELALGGWQMNTIVQAQTGSPFSIVYPTYGGSYSIRASANGPILFPRSISGQYFTGTFVQPPTGSEGNTGRNQFFGPGSASGDVSLFKTLHFTERFSTELRAEVYNVTNTPQFTNPDGNPNDGTFGRVTATREYSERQMQMAIRFLF